jgi:colanic acid/amylovoran biosynthesis glycosyltransferase
MRDAGIVEGSIITFFHGYDFSLQARVRGRGPYRRLFERGAAFVANSNYTRGRIVELGCPSERTVTVPVGLFPDFFSFRERAAAPGRPVRFLTIGRLVEKKGHGVAIHAFRRLRDAGVAATYAIVGDGPMRRELEQLVASLGLGDAITLLGSRSQEDVRRLAENADIFVLASTTSADGDAEGQGLVLQEAQAMGLPVVATNHNGFPEGLLDGVSGVLVPERDSAGLAGAMIELARSPDRWAPMGRAGAAFVRDRFDQSRLTENLLTLLIPYERKGGRRLRVVRPEPRQLVLGHRQIC